MAEGAAAAKQGNSFVAELEASNLHPLWDRYQRITPIKPQPRDAPFLWRWREIEPFVWRDVDGEEARAFLERVVARIDFGGVLQNRLDQVWRQRRIRMEHQRHGAA